MSASTFPSLPTELRFIIWNETFEPRILHITPENITLSPPPIERFHKSPTTHIRFKSLEGPPVALHICRESRALALKHYTPSFRSFTIPKAHASETKQIAIYFSPELDTVHVVDDWGIKFQDLLLADEETLRSIRILAVGARLCQSELRPHTALSLLRFKTLERLIFVDEGETSNLEAMELMQDELFDVQESGVLELEEDIEWDPPEIMTMSPQALESQLWL